MANDLTDSELLRCYVSDNAETAFTALVGKHVAVVNAKKCLVGDWEIKDAGKEVKLNSGTVVVACSDECAEKLKAAPEKLSQHK